MSLYTRCHKKDRKCDRFPHLLQRDCYYYSDSPEVARYLRTTNLEPQRTTDPVALELYRQKIATSRHYNFFTPEKGMSLVKRGGFAYHVDSVTAYTIMRRSFSEREICDAHEIQLYPPQTMAAALSKHSPYREHVATGIRKIYEAGLMHRLKSVWDEPKPPCVHTPDTSIFNVTLREFSSALMLLAFGIALAVAILAGEIAHHKYKWTPIEFRH